MTEQPPSPNRTWKLDVCGQTDLGRQRTNNEDNFLVVDLERAASTNENVCALHDIGAKGTLLIVADGMGGANAGEVASQMAVEIISRVVTDTWSDGNGQVPDEFLGKIVEAVKTSNREIKARGMEDETKRGMGSTCVVAGVIAGKALLCNVGDSRGYLLRGTEVKQMTHDQSFVQHLLDVGAITKEQAVRSPRRNVVMEALGAREEVNVAQVIPHDCEHGDILVLCSDGLTGHVEDEEILRVAYSTTDQKERCKRLIELANERGGKDNITVIVAEVKEDGQPEVVRPQLPPIEPKPAEPPPDNISEPSPMPIALSPDEPLESDGDLNSQGREYSLAIGFILGLSVGLVASVIFLGEHLRGQRDELQKSYQSELAQKEAAAAGARMQADNVQKALEALERKNDQLERDVATYFSDWQKWADETLAGKKQTHYPPEPDTIHDLVKKLEPDDEAPASPDPGASPAMAPASPEPVAAPASPEPAASPASPQPAASPSSPEPAASPASPEPAASPASPEPAELAVPPTIATVAPSASPQVTPSPAGSPEPVMPATPPSAAPAATPSPEPTPAAPDAGGNVSPTQLPPKVDAAPVASPSAAAPDVTPSVEAPAASPAASPSSGVKDIVVPSAAPSVLETTPEPTSSPAPTESPAPVTASPAGPTEPVTPR